MDLLSLAANLCQLLTPIIALVGGLWMRRFSRKERSMRDPISIRLIGSTSPTWVELPYAPPRSSVSRAEIMGIIGMFAGSRRYNISLVSNLMSGELDAVAQPFGLTYLNIQVSDEELKAFSESINKKA